jgi:hypothetical protein
MQSHHKGIAIHHDSIDRAQGYQDFLTRHASLAKHHAAQTNMSRFDFLLG